MIGAEEWNEFLHEVQVTRIDLKCSTSSAWFRGHSSSLWKLQPSLLREYVIGELGTTGLAAAPYLTDDEFETAFKITESKKCYRLKLSADQAKRISQLLRSYELGAKRFKVLSKQVQELERLAVESEKAQNGSILTRTMSASRLIELGQKHKIPMVPLGTSSHAVASVLRQIDLGLVYKLLEKNRLAQKEQGNMLDGVRASLRFKLAVAYGERDAFSDFSFRWREPLGNGWSALAQMQHYGVPTRLLDWTESLSVGLWFALEPYFTAVAKSARSMPGKRPEDVVAEVIEETGGHPPASLWVLNPYYLAQLSTGENRISDLSHENGLDYYQKFFEEGWPYKSALPIYSPWRDERLNSQHAMFTLHGTSLAPLDEQAEGRMLRQLCIDHKAAAFGAYQLSALFLTDKYSLFRDMDSLGKKIKDKYIV
jgi:hypothetical protein